MSSAMTPRRRRLLADVRRDLGAVQTEWLAATRQHEVRVAGQFKELGRRVQVRAKGRQPKGLPTADQAQALQDLLAGVRLKPAKGRAKDLRKVERTLDAMLAALPEQD